MCIDCEKEGYFEVRLTGLVKLASAGSGRIGRLLLL